MTVTRRTAFATSFVPLTGGAALADVLANKTPARQALTAVAPAAGAAIQKSLPK